MLVYLHNHAADRLRSLASKKEILQFLINLERTPITTAADYTQPDPKGRIIEVKIFHRQAILFFRDPFANIIKVLDIRHLETI